MRRLIKLILAAVLFFANLAVFSVNKTVAALSLAVEQVSSSILSSDVYVYDQSGANTADGRLNEVAPTYLIYPDAKVDLSGAADLLDDLGIVSHLDEYTTKAYVINPVNDNYDDALDEAAYLDVLEFLGINANVKVIGIGDGATFVNDVVSQNSWCVAGIMSYGGDSAVANVPNSVPAYLHGASASVANAYIDANSAAAVSDGVYINPDNELEKVVVSDMSDAEESLDAAFNNAWDSVFGNNYRMYNEYEEWYTAGLLKYQTPYELVSYVNYDKLGITVKNQTGLITSDATVAKPNQWYEYIPSNMAAASEGTIPLVVTLHGNTNDNRMQGETSGWVEKAAEQGFMVIACEHQASGNTIFDKYTALQEQGTIDVVKKVLNDYPQLDPSRVYLCGLSMGAMRSYLWGINNSEIFAAVEGTAGVQSSQIVDNAQAQVDAGTSTQTPVYMVSGTHDVYGMIPVTDSASFSGYNVIKAYGLYNGLDIPAAPDLSKNEWYGLELDNQGWDTYNDTDVYAGTLSNEKGVMLKAVAMDPYAHWNNKQIIDDVWDFFSQYSKNPQTGVLTVGEPKTIAQDLAGDGVAVYGAYTIEQEATNVYHIHDSATSNPSSMYLLLGEDDALLIDGSNGTKPAQFDYILNSLIGDRELAMAITHNHGDHMGLLANQTIANDVKIYVPRDDYNATTQQLLANNGYGNISLLDDQDVITCGDFNLTAQYLKGHTNGGMVFIEPDKELVFSGDEVGSGFAWILFVDDALTKYEQGLRDLIATTASMDNLVILPGHKWQTTMTTESGTEGPGALGATYLQDMLKVLDGIANGTAKLTDYTHVATYFPDSVEATVAGAKAAIDTRSSLIDQYVAGIEQTKETFLNTLAADGVAVYGSYTVEQEAKNVYHIYDSATSNPSSMYLLLGEDDALLIDGSNGTQPLDFSRLLDSLIGDRELAMAITHNHGDHLGLLASQTIANDVKIYVPRDDYNATTQQLLENNGYVNISLLDNQDVIICGDFNLTAQYLKGHTNGGMVFIEPDKELVFSGDEVGSGFAWILFVDDALTKYEQGLRDLISTTASMDNLVILPGHKWQTTMTTESGTKGPGVLGAKYLQDMLKVLDGIANGTAKLTDYTHVATYFPDSVEATVAGSKAAIDTRSSLIDQYVAGKNVVGKTIVNQNNSVATSVVVDTGDEAPIVIYYGLAAIGIIGLLVLNKRKFGR